MKKHLEQKEVSFNQLNEKGLDDSQQSITIASNTGCATSSFITNTAFDFLSVLMTLCTDRIKSVTEATKLIVLVVAYYTPKSLQ